MARYVLERRIGEGGMAEVFRARAEAPGGFVRTCAVKRLLPEYARDARVQARFLDEARIAARLDHPCIVDVFDFYEDAGLQHLAMEFVDGASVEHLVQQGFAGRFVPLAIAARIVHDTARAIEHAHARSVLHRDVSCCNILVSREGEVKLADFGLADARERVSSTDPGEIAGKSLYLSPERKAGHGATTLDDVYALGVVLGRLLDAADPRERGSAAGERLRALEEHLVAPRDRRLPSASALLAELREQSLASAEALAELVRDNPVPRPSPARRPLSADELDDTTDDGSGRDDEPTQPAGRQALRAAAIGAAAAVLVLVVVALLTGT